MAVNDNPLLCSTSILHLEMEDGKTIPPVPQEEVAKFRESVPFSLRGIRGRLDYAAE